MKKAVQSKLKKSKTQKIKKINRKRKIGLVIRKKMPQTAVVEIEMLKKHPYYHKRFKSHKKIAAHDEKDEVKVGDKVEIEECRPISKTKSWKIIEIIK